MCTYYMYDMYVYIYNMYACILFLRVCLFLSLGFSHGFHSKSPLSSQWLYQVTTVSIHLLRKSLPEQRQQKTRQGSSSYPFCGVQTMVPICSDFPVIVQWLSW